MDEKIVYSGSSAAYVVIGMQPGRTAGQHCRQQPCQPLAGRVVPSFSAYVLNGQVVTEQVFRKHNLTMINIWGT